MSILDLLPWRRSARTEGQFLRLALSVARADASLDAAEIHPEVEFAILIDDHRLGPFALVLDHPWAAARGEPLRTQRAILADHLEMHLAQADRPQSWEEVRDVLVALLRDVTYASHAHDGPQVVARPAFDGLSAVLYLDLGTTVSTVAPDDLVAWGVAPEEVWSVALANTARCAPDIEVEGERALHRIGSGDIDAGSYLVAPTWAARLLGKEGCVFWVSDRDWLVVIAGCDPDGLGAIAQRAREEWEEAPRRVSPRLYRVERGAVVPVAVAPGQPGFEELERSRQARIWSRYSDQKAALDARYEAEGEDVWVASLFIDEARGGLISVAIWTCDCVSMLPRADVVSMVRSVDDGDDEVFELAMDDVIEAADLTPVEGLEPERYFVETWPDDRVLEALGRPRPG